MSSRKAKAEPTLFLHIGLPKTATTYLQARIFPQLDRLLYFDTPKDPAFDGPVDRGMGSRIMSCLFNRDPRVWQTHGEAVFEQLLGRRSDWQPRDVLISDEGIGRTGSRPDHLAAHLREVSVVAQDWSLRRVAVICAFRRQDHWLGSHYSQMSDRNPKASQSDFNRACRDLLRVTADRFKLGMMLDYATLRDALVGVVGQENVLMYPYERQKINPDAVLAQVLDFLGEGAAPKASASLCKDGGSVGPAGVNVRSLGENLWSIRPYGAGLKLRPYRLVQWAGLPDHVFFPRLGRPRSFTLTENDSRTLLAAYAVSNRRLASELGIDLAQYGYFDDVSSAAEPPQKS